MTKLSLLQKKVFTFVAVPSKIVISEQFLGAAVFPSGPCTPGQLPPWAGGAGRRSSAGGWSPPGPGTWQSPPSPCPLTCSPGA